MRITKRWKKYRKGISKEVIGEGDTEECCRVYIALRLKVIVRGKYRGYWGPFILQRNKKKC
jgi:hypothetical protein